MVQYYINESPKSEIAYMVIYTRAEKYFMGSGKEVLRPHKVFAIYHKSTSDWTIHRFKYMPYFMTLCLNNNKYNISFSDDLLRLNEEITTLNGAYILSYEVPFDDESVIDIDQRLVLGKDADNVCSPLPWYDFDSNINSIAIIARLIILQFPDSQVYALGQSLAWVVKAIEILAPEFHCGYIPFSGSFVDKNKEGPPVIYEKSEARYPTEAQINGYRNVLDVWCNPKQIVKLFQHENRQTLILEFANTGSGLVSFLYLLHEYAKTVLNKDDYLEFQKAITVLVIDDCRVIDGSKKTQEKQEQCELLYDGKVFKINLMFLQNVVIEDGRTVSIDSNFDGIQAGVELIWNLANGEDHGKKNRID